MSAQPIRVIVVDDETMPRQDLVHRLAAYEDVAVVGEADGGASGIELAKRVNPDVAFLDVRMPEVDGLDVAEVLEESPTAVVFVTAFDHFAVRAFELGTLDYLTKPVRPERLEKTLDRIRRQRGGPAPATLSSFLSAPPDDVFVFRSLGSIVVLEFAEIVYVEANGNYVSVYGLVNGELRNWLKRTTLEASEGELAQHGFFRAHRSFLVNRAHLLSIQRKGRTFEAELTGGARVPVSRSVASQIRR